MPAVPRPERLTACLTELRARIASLERGRGGGRRHRALSFGLEPIDRALPEGGLACGALHEICGSGADVEHGAAAALLIAGLLARGRGPVLWVLERPDLFAPGLAGVGLQPGRLIQVEAGAPASVLLAMEEGLRHGGLAGVVGEVARLGLGASRRLQLAAEGSGVTAFALRRSRRPDDPARAEPSAAHSRWRVSCLPAPPALPHSPQTPGLARARWRLELVRIRGGEPGCWEVEAWDGQGRLALVADLADGSAAPAPGQRHAG